MAAVQLDHVSLHAKELIESLKNDLAEISDDNRLVQTAAQRLLTWDGNCGESSVEAAIFHAFHHRLLYNLLAPVLGDVLFCSYVEILNQCIVPTDRILRESSAAWFAGRSRFDLVSLSLREACAEISEQLGSNSDRWSWGEIHKLHLNHALGRIDVLKAALSIGPLATPGDGMTVNQGFYRHSNPYTQTVGASLRFAAELGDPLCSGAVLAAGQSGHPTSRHYADQTDLWARGERIPLGGIDEERKRGNQRLLLKPFHATIAPQGASS
jgi:penicillin amidase